MRLSIVTTLYRSAAHLPEFHARAGRAAAQCTSDYEILLVNDGSPDDSLAVALGLLESDQRVRVVDLARNFGHHRAMMTGLAHARGDLIFLIDSDLEEDPELLTSFLEALQRTGADVVYGVQRERRGGFLERWSGKLFYALFNLLSEHRIPENVLTVRLMTRRYVTALVAHREQETMIAGLLTMTGFQQVPRSVVKHAKSKTTYSLKRKIALFVNAITSFSARPLELIFYLGVTIGFVATAAAVYLLVRRMFFGILLPGWPSLIVSVWLLGGLMLACMGIIGIYLSKIFIETKQRPYTIVRHIHERASVSSDSRDGRVQLR
jgi:putative glycosyltransferase